MRISVCMAVYNGEKYIREQLESIFLQSRKPDEVIICDDGSSDAGPELIRSFVREKGLEDAWKFSVNGENKGYPGNFYHAMSLCTGDVVFLSDQDDIWEERKLERMCRFLEERPDARAVCCKFGLIDAEGADIKSVMTPVKSGETGGTREVDILAVFYKCEWPGMVVAYRREWFEKRRGGRAFGIPHDFLVCAWAAEEKGFFQLDEELAYHRRHGNNAGGEEHRIGRLLNRERKLEEIERYRKILEAFAKEGVLRTQEGRDALDRKRRAMAGRYEALAAGRLGPVLHNAWANRRETRPATFVCDVLIALRR